MRSNQIHRALAQGINRFEVCQLVSKGVRATHVFGSRFEDTINQTLDHLSTHKSDPHRRQKDEAEEINPTD